MKKIVIALALLCAVASACTEADTGPSSEIGTGVSSGAGADIISSDERQASSVVSQTSGNEQRDEYYDPFDENLKHPETDDPMAVSNLFPDPHFAYYIAGILGKNVSDTVTFEELGAFRGIISIGPGVIKSIEGIGYLTGITGFESAKNKLEEIPDEIGKCVNIRYINLLKAYNLKRITPEIGKLTKLEFLRADITELGELPKEIGCCTELEVLMIDNTNITSIPEELGNCVKLKYLDVHQNNISSLPDSLSRLTNLELLNIGHLEIDRLFNGIENLKQLRILNAGGNSISVLPEEVCSLTALERLDLFAWNLKSLPEGLKTLENLKYLNVFDNFNLSEEYKSWFNEDVYGCKNDPNKDSYWFGLIYPDKYE